MRPCGPEPSIRERSRSFSRAKRRTIGEARTWPSVWAPSPEGSPPACGCSSAVPSSSSVSVTVWAWASPSPPSSASSSASPPPSAAPPSRSGTSSPSPWIKAIASPTGTSSPSPAINWARVPESSASISMEALSVSISAIGSPSETSSPSLTSHLTRVPSSIAPAVLGISTSGPAHPLHRRVQVVERPLLDTRRNLARHPEPPPLLLHRDRPVRLFDRLDDRLLVERPDAAQVYDLGTYIVLFFKLVGHAHAQVDLPTI